ncbi:DUF4235 domain-containing protein [Kitasatospora sp. NA04385]|uniref:DUF4235 domain-containing protein n=1 Tax=Kitasatospora sp. NA04385 TaxID=2742135 RepID=UPI00158FEB9E|nr:DUF4235 domain-containing protein [Kitasatospora sp. NA04385]QKW17848.1 DUF4235 domain-containing protein [Kitasatospora sp. NA04385]
MKAVAVLYKPVGLTLGVVGGMVAGVAFKQVWKAVGHSDDAPDPTDKDHGWGEVLFAAALHGAVFGLVKAAIDRGGAVGVRRLTGTWPD